MNEDKELMEEIEKYVETPENQGNPDLKKELAECAKYFVRWEKERALKKFYSRLSRNK